MEKIEKIEEKNNNPKTNSRLWETIKEIGSSFANFVKSLSNEEPETDGELTELEKMSLGDAEEAERHLGSDDVKEVNPKPEKSLQNPNPVREEIGSDERGKYNGVDVTMINQNPRNFPEKSGIERE